MKKLILGALLLLSMSSFSQLRKIEDENPPLIETKIAPMGNLWVSAKIYEDHVYITFADANYTTINVYETFSISIEDFNNLYELLIKEDNKPGDFYEIKCFERNKSLYIKYSKSLGVIYPMIILFNNGNDSRICTLSKSQLRKLFNKPKE